MRLIVCDRLLGTVFRNEASHFSSGLCGCSQDEEVKPWCNTQHTLRLW